MTAASVVQSGKYTNADTTITSYTIELTDVVEGHALLLHSVNLSSNGGVTSVTDDAGTSYTWRQVVDTSAWARAATGDTFSTDVWIGTGGSGGSVTVTVHYGADCLAGGTLHELVAATTPVRQVSASLTTGTAGSCPTLSTTADQLVVCLIATYGYKGVKTFPASPWTTYDGPSSSTGPMGCAAWRNGTGSAIGATWTATNGTRWLAISLTIAGPTTPAPPESATYSARSGFPVHSYTDSLSITTTDVGDLVAVVVNGQSDTISEALPTVTDSESRVSWSSSPWVTQKIAADDHSGSWIVVGTVESVGSTTIGVTWNHTPGTLAVCAYEFGSSLGTSGEWMLVNPGTTAVLSTGSGDTTVTFCPLWSSTSGGVYLGYAGLETTPTVGSTSGFNYYTFSDHGTSGFITCYNASLSANTIYAPTCTQPDTTGGVYETSAVVFLAAPPPAITLAGTSSSVSSLSGKLFVLAPGGQLSGLQGQALTGDKIQGFHGAAEGGAVALGGTSSSVSSASASLTVAVALSGSSDSTSTLSGALSVGAALAGASESSSSFSGTLTVGLALEGTSASASTLSGSLSESISLAGMSASVSSMQGTLSVSVGEALAGESASTSTLSGTLSVNVALAGSSDSTSSLSGVLSGPISLEGTCTSASSLSGNLSVGIVLVGTSTSTSSLSGSLVGPVVLAGLSSSTSTLSGTLTVSVGESLAGISESSSSLSASLTAPVALAGSSESTSTLSGSLTVSSGVELAGTITSTSSLSGNLSVKVGISGSSTSSSTLSGTLSTGVQLSGSCTSASSLSANLSVPVALTGTSTSTSSASGSLSTGPVRLAGSASSVSTLRGTLTVGLPYVAGKVSIALAPASATVVNVSASVAIELALDSVSIALEVQ